MRSSSLIVLLTVLCGCGQSGDVSRLRDVGETSAPAERTAFVMNGTLADVRTVEATSEQVRSEIDIQDRPYRADSRFIE